jgi:copper(I)-binding protein
MFRGGDLNSFRNIWELPVQGGGATQYGHDLNTMHLMLLDTKNNNSKVFKI